MDPSEAPQSDSVAPNAGAASTVGTDAVGAGDAQLPLAELQASLLEISLDSHDKDALLAAMGRIVDRYTNSVAVVYFQQTANGALAAKDQEALDELNTTFGLDNNVWTAWSETACAQGQLQQQRIEGALPALVLVVPVTRPGQAPEAFCAVFRASRSPSYGVVILLQAVAAHMTLWFLHQDYHQADSESNELCALVEVLGKVERAKSPQHAAFIVANELQSYLKCKRVAVGLTKGRTSHCDLESLSGVSNFDKRSAYVRTVEAALDEALLKDELTAWSAAGDAEAEAAIAHQQLCAAEGCGGVLSSPLRTADGEMVGAWVFMGDERFEESPAAVRFVRAASATVGSSLALVGEARCSMPIRLLRGLKRKCQSRWLKIAFVASAVIVGALCIPMRYKLKCESTIEPVTRRYVAAPFDSTLEKTLVEPGDLVRQSESLAQLDGRELRWELAGLEADLNRARKDRDAAMAARKAAEAQIARLEMDGLELKIRKLQYRTEQLRIESPVDGIVVTGDLERVEGAPLTVGQTLFEIAPLDAMIVEVAIPESEIAHVSQDMEVLVKLESYPDRTWTGKLQRIHPRSEIRDQESVYIGEVRLENTSGVLRPGMHGESKVIGARRALGWILFHRPWEAMRRKVGW